MTPKGLLPGSVVSRGPDWSAEDQDGMNPGNNYFYYMNKIAKIKIDNVLTFTSGCESTTMD